MCTKILYYNIIESPFTKNGSVNIDRRCNGWVVKNTGNTLLTVNTEAIQPGGSKSIGGNYGEIFNGTVNLFFSGPSLIPSQPTALNACIVTQKVYINLDLKNESIR